MPRIPHGLIVTVNDLRAARHELAAASQQTPLGFAATRPGKLTDYNFLFPRLQNDPYNLLPEGQTTRDNLVQLGRAMHDTGDSGDGEMPAVYTYFGQFVDHDITCDMVSAPLPELLSPELRPLTHAEMRGRLRNMRTGTLDLDSVYGLPAPRDPQDARKVQVGRVDPVPGADILPNLRPAGKDDENDLLRMPRNETDSKNDRAALIGDPRNDEHAIISQMHVAFLRAHNALVNRGHGFSEASRLLRQHYQFLVLDDFLPRVADAQIVGAILNNGNRIYDGLAEPFFMPLEFSVAAFRFGHSLVRPAYNYNLNFNFSDAQGTRPATLRLLFHLSAFAGGLAGHDTLPENWIIEWERFVGEGEINRARRLDTKLVEPLFHLRDVTGMPEQGDGARLAVRNLLRGYLLRIPTGQAVARELGQDPLTPGQIIAASASDKQAQALTEAGFLEHTPLWFYLLAEAAHGGGQRLGLVGSVIVAEVLIGLIRRSQDSILRTSGWQPTLRGDGSGQFELPDLLRLAGVL